MRAMKGSSALRPLWILALVIASSPAFATTFTGRVQLLEVWKNGNIAFSLDPAITGCNSQFILNSSASGTKNQYAALLAAKKTGSQVTVYVGGACIAADGYGGNYHEPLYLYVLD